MRVREPEEKVLTRAQLLERHGRPRDGVLVFTNGCFDLLHRGHVTYLAAARVLGDALVVGVNTDASVRRLDKGGDRPLVAEADRAYVLASLEAVDAVCLFDEDTPAELIGALLPDVLVKGADYELDQVAGGSEVVAAGGRVALLPIVEGYSTTSLIARIREGG
ncbi:MAG TPA: D-glycero-beta-D-manno-heptose 1-phosphate adenylyltransferase [Longimicrobiales bacterium]|nr:D-glycero-beta-D-manno-heptose 1-phosphate adenylyltransferase [Longimicrobiales bacterium]